MPVARSGDAHNARRHAHRGCQTRPARASCRSETPACCQTGHRATSRYDCPWHNPGSRPPSQTTRWPHRSNCESWWPRHPRPPRRKPAACPSQSAAATGTCHWPRGRAGRCKAGSPGTYCSADRPRKPDGPPLPAPAARQSPGSPNQTPPHLRCCASFPGCCWSMTALPCPGPAHQRWAN